MTAGCWVARWSTLPVSSVLVATSLTAAEVTRELEFPRTYQGKQATLVLHAPQIDSWRSQEINAWQAVQVILRDNEQQYLGAVQLRAVARPDLTARTVEIGQTVVLHAKFPGVDAATLQIIESELEGYLDREDVVYPLDLLTRYVEDQRSKTREPARLSYRPPEIAYSDTPAILVIFHGPPVFNRIASANLEFAVNTNWDLFRDPADQALYLLYGEIWLKAGSLEGQWKHAETLPAGMAKLPQDGNWVDVLGRVPLRPAPGEAPKVVVSQKPAELIVTDGPPKLEEIPLTELSYVVNTTSDLLRHQPSGSYYFLVAGRWFKAADLDGPWESGLPLPPTFAQIPDDSDRADVKIAVADTWQAGLAALEAGLTVQATVDRKTAPDRVSVRYFGEPRFEPIPKTALRYAVNTVSDVIDHEGTFYLCDHAAWFFAAWPNGPWTLAAAVPREVYRIPPESPLYRVTFVKVRSRTEDAVEFECAAGYQNVFVDNGTVVFGTGYDYPATWYTEKGWSYWIPYYPTYGSHAYLDPYLQRFRAGNESYGPYGGQVLGLARDPATGAYHRSSFTAGPSGADGSQAAQLATDETRVARMYLEDPYEKWTRPTVEMPLAGALASGQRPAPSQPQVQPQPEAQPIAIPGAGLVRPAAGGLYVAENGDVYRPSQVGWVRWSGGAWISVAAEAQQKTMDAEYERRLAYLQRQAAIQESRARAARANRYRYVRSVNRYRYPVFHRYPWTWTTTIKK